MVTIYDYDPAYRGAAFVGNQQLNRPGDRTDVVPHARVHAESSADDRSVGRQHVVHATKNHRYLVGIPSSPNDDYFPIDETWDLGLQGDRAATASRTTSSFSGVFDMQPGVSGSARTSSAPPIPTAGRRCGSCRTVTLRLEPYGEQVGPMRPAANLRLSKFLKLPKGQLQLSLDALNAFNTNTFWSMTFASGPTFGYGTAFTSPRALQFGVGLRVLIASWRTRP